MKEEAGHTPTPRPALRRSSTDRMFTGVSAGVAFHLGAPVKWVRIAFVVLTFFGGAGAILYFFLLVTMPSDMGAGAQIPLKNIFTPPKEQHTHNPNISSEPKTSSEPSISIGPKISNEPKISKSWPVAEILLGGALLVAGLALVAKQLGLSVQTNLILPGLVVLVGVGLTWWLITSRTDSSKSLVPRVLASLSLVAVGVLLFFVTASEPNILTVIGAAIAVLAGVGFAIAPWLLRINQELIDERSARERERARAEFAAHLHDSVLQTLALIQQRSDPASDVARIARAQERELREWIFDGGGPKDTEADIYEELRAHAAKIEQDYAVHFEVVSVGPRVKGQEAITLAAKEAMLNAARHAGGEVSVYIESNAEKLLIEINDRGPGFEVSQIGDSRFGVKESILGRMERAGGSASITARASAGMSVRLQQSHDEKGEKVE